MKKNKTMNQADAAANSPARVRPARRILSYMKRYWLQYAVVYISMVVATVLNAAIPMYIGRIIDEVILDTGSEWAVRMKLLTSLICLLLAVGLGHSVFNYIKEFTADKIGQRIGGNMRRDLFRHIQGLSVGFFNENNTGELMARVKEDIDKVCFVIGFAGMLAVECVVHTAITMFCMVRISPLLTIVPVVVMIVVAFLAVSMERQLDKCFDAISEQNAELNTVAQENLTGVRTVKAFARESFEIDKFAKHNEKYYKLNMNLMKVLVKHQPYINVASKILLIAVVLTGGALVLLRGSITLGDLTAFVEYANNIVWPIECIAWLGTEIAAAVASDRKVRRILDCHPVITEPTDPIVLDEVRGDVAFNHVSFTIDDNKILDDVSFDLPRGNTLGIIGMTGSGKSTIVNLVERFHDVTDGSVTLDGVDIRRLGLNQLRANVSVVMQDVFLFSDSISENVSLGRRGKLSEEELRKAAEDACASEFIDKLELGYETIIGERGVGLSGGQKQRISIARAFAKNAPVLVLDDATSALDMETEYQLQQSLKRHTDTTKIIIAHRISAVKNANEIIILENGRVVERGTHAELMALRGHYFATYVAQYNTEEDMVVAQTNNINGKEAVSYVG